MENIAATGDDTVILIGSLDHRHCARVVDLILPIQQKEFNVPITLEEQPDLLDIEGFYIRPGGGFWGAFSGGKLVGTIGGDRNPLMSRGPAADMQVRRFSVRHPNSAFRSRTNRKRSQRYTISFTLIAVTTAF